VSYSNSKTGGIEVYHAKDLFAAVQNKPVLGRGPTMDALTALTRRRSVHPGTVRVWMMFWPWRT